MLTLSVEQVAAVGGDALWNIFRVAGFFMVVPIFGNRLVPARVRLSLAVAVGLALTPVLGGGVSLLEIDLSAVSHLAVQSLMAMGLGFAAVIFFQLFVVAGQFIGMQMGLGFAAMVDPGNGVSVTVWSQFFLMLVTLSFLALNGHLVLVEILVTGFMLYPEGGALTLTEFAGRLVRMGGWMFIGGVLLAIPAVVSLLIVNLAFGIMNRSAPPLNVFSLGFPFSLLFGLAIIWFLLYGWGDQFSRLLDAFFVRAFDLTGT